MPGYVIIVQCPQYGSTKCLQKKIMDNRNELQSRAAKAIENFRENRIFQTLDSGPITKADYQSLLLMIFHQTFEVPGTFALAGVNCSTRFQQVKEYLFHHADEEKSHWQWVIDDL